MPVAPSFEAYKRITDEPFMKNGKLYITVEHPNTKNKRDVRWYSETEFAKAYGKKLQDNPDPDYWKGLKQCRGFSKGPILVIRRNLPSDEEWLRASVARYAVGIGWFITSDDEFPDNAPEHFKYLLLGWNEFKLNDDFHMKPAAELAEILDKKARNGEWVNIH